MSRLILDVVEDQKHVTKILPLQGPEKTPEEWQRSASATLPPEGVYILGVDLEKSDPYSVVMLPIRSSNISHLGYDPTFEKMLVAFKFQKGTEPSRISLYQYGDVLPEMFLGLLAASSVGAQFQAIKKNLVDYQKLAG